MKQIQYDQNDGDHDQGMDPTACLRDPCTYVPAEKAEQPQDYKNYDDCPQHEITPFGRSDYWKLPGQLTG